MIAKADEMRIIMNKEYFRFHNRMHAAKRYAPLIGLTESNMDTVSKARRKQDRIV